MLWKQRFKRNTVKPVRRKTDAAHGHRAIVLTNDLIELAQRRCLRPIMGLSLALVLSACTTFEYHETVNVPISKLSEEQEAALDEDLLLDVGIVLFDHGVDELDDDAAAYANVRKSEAVWFTTQLTTTLDRSNAWGMVRALPSDIGAMDVIVKGRLIDSHGERVVINIQVASAGGEPWFQKEYQQVVSQYAYNPEVNLPGDPFQALFNRIANDLFDYLGNLSEPQLRRIRSTTKVLFARDFVPAAFSGYLGEDKEGRTTLQRVPASNDPMMLKVDRIRSRNDLFLDVIQDYYRAFNNSMSEPYQEWRKLSYKEVLKERQLKEQARKEKIAGLAVIAGGVAVANSNSSRTTRVGGLFGAGYGARIFARSFAKQDEALSHSETLRELGSSLELELEPSVVDLQDRSVTLTGTVQDQYQEWRRILSRMFEINEGDEANGESSGGNQASSGQAIGNSQQY